MKQENKKIPLWADMIIAIIIGLIIILIIGKYYQERNRTGEEQFENEIKSKPELYNPEYYPNSSSSSFKSFEDVANEYDMTPEELESAIERGMSPDDFR